MGPALNDLQEAWLGLGGKLDSLQVMSAAFITSQYYPRLDPGQAALIVGLEGADQDSLQRLQHILLLAYAPDWQITIIEGDAQRTAQLADLSALTSAGHAVSVLIPPLPGAGSFEALQDVVAHLRAPEGCPWDRALTWAKLRSTLLEETYELLAALDADQPAKVAEELGDLLLQVAMQAQIAVEEGRFRPPQVIAGIVEKLVRRHPHVFGDTVVSGPAEVLANWEAIKRAERASNGQEESPLAGIPPGLPALAQADAYLDRLSRLREEQAPEAPWRPLAEIPPGAGVTPEMLGRVLFGLVAWARSRGVDAESALREVNAQYAAQVERESSVKRET